ncbi:MAG: hypothetical protein V4850_26270 [Myxococcota bacterium]
MSLWPDVVDSERLTGALLRVDLYEGRYLAVVEYHNVVNHLLRSASAACLLNREADALALVDRAGRRMVEWIDAVSEGRVKPGSYADFAATRGLLALALAPHERRAASLEAARTFLRQTADAPPGSVHNARLAAAALLEDAPTLQAAARACELSDAGLGLPWRRFATALDTNDATGAAKSAHTWLREKMEATHTNEWGAYNEIPIEVSAALALAGARGLFVKLASNRVMTGLRA